MEEIIDKWEMKIAQIEVAMNYINESALAGKALQSELDLIEEFVKDLKQVKNNNV